MSNLKICLMGGSCVGKTELVYKLLTGENPRVLERTVEDIYRTNTKIEGKDY